MRENPDVRQVTAQGPQRSTVSTSSSSTSLLPKRASSSGGGGGGGFSGLIVASALVVGVLLGLLMAGIISAFVGGKDPSTTAGTAGRSSDPSSETAQRQRQNVTETQRRDAQRASQTVEDRDVRVTGCGADADGFAAARVLITNGSARTATYHVRVIFAAATDGGIVSDDVASVRRLPPGRTAPLQTVHSVDPAPPGGVICRLAAVNRF